MSELKDCWCGAATAAALSGSRHDCRIAALESQLAESIEYARLADAKIVGMEEKLKVAVEALETYASKTTLHSVRNGYGVFNSPGPECAKDALAAIRKLTRPDAPDASQ